MLQYYSVAGRVEGGRGGHEECKRQAFVYEYLQTMLERDGEFQRP
jgi:hypothetical protein